MTKYITVKLTEDQVETIIWELRDTLITENLTPKQKAFKKRLITKLAQAKIS